MLLAIPNFSEGRDPAVIASLRAALDADRGVLDRHSDAEHNRTVFTVAGPTRELGEALFDAAALAIERIDMSRYGGLHPSIGALDVCPVAWLDQEHRAAAEALARSVAQMIAELDVPVFLYGALASSAEREERAFFRRGGLPELARRMSAGELRSDFGPNVPHPKGGATLISARAPLAAFNVELDRGDAAMAQRVAGALREGGGGLAGVRAIGLPLESGRTQISTNVHDPIAVPLRVVLSQVSELAGAQGARPVEAEIVGLVPAAAMEGFPADFPIRSFDPEQSVIERRVKRG